MEIVINNKIESLTLRQREVLEKIVDGLSYTQIAEDLFISPETVRTHKKNIYRKLEVKNHIGAIKMYLIKEIMVKMNS
jgi:RNA polymerase sigma factor (sigma-70 family)